MFLISKIQNGFELIPLTQTSFSIGKMCMIISEQIQNWCAVRFQNCLSNECAIAMWSIPLWHVTALTTHSQRTLSIYDYSMLKRVSDIVWLQSRQQPPLDGWPCEMNGRDGMAGPCVPFWLRTIIIAVRIREFGIKQHDAGVWCWYKGDRERVCAVAIWMCVCVFVCAGWPAMQAENGPPYLPSHISFAHLFNYVIVQRKSKWVRFVYGISMCPWSEITWCCRLDSHLWIFLVWRLRNHIIIIAFVHHTIDNEMQCYFGKW